MNMPTSIREVLTKQLASLYQDADNASNSMGNARDRLDSSTVQYINARVRLADFVNMLADGDYDDVYNTYHLTPRATCAHITLESWLDRGYCNCCGSLLAGGSKE